MFRRNFPQTQVVPLDRRRWPASASVLAMEAGWVVTEVGRQPWIVVDYMKVEEAATGNTGVWITFLAIVGIYIGVAVTLVLVLRAMSRRFREQGDRGRARRPVRPAASPEAVTAEHRGAPTP